MGQQHGVLARTAGAEPALAYYPAMPSRVLLGDVGGVAGALGRLGLGAAARLWASRLGAERPAPARARTAAYAAAAGDSAEVSARIAASVAVMDVTQNLIATAARLALGPFARVAPGAAAPLATMALRGAQPACSTVMTWGPGSEGGAVRFARNFDFFGVGVWDAAPALVLCRPRHGQAYGFVTTRGVDAPVVTVFNQAGLVIAPHTRFHRDVRWGGAAIVDLVHELGQHATSLAEAERIVRARPVSSTWGIAVASAAEQRGCVFEVNGARVERVDPAPGQHHLTCANRYRHPAMQGGEIAASPAWALHSDQRERRLHALAEAAETGGGASARDLARMLGDRRDPDDPDRVRHAGAIVAQASNVHACVVEPGARRLYLGVDAAPTCEGRWLEVSWDWDGPAGSWELGRPEVGPGTGGFVVRELTDWAEPHDGATVALHQAARAHEAGDDRAFAGALELAVALAPRDPSLRLLATWAQLRVGQAERALAHAEAGLADEVVAYRRTQLTTWAEVARAGGARRPSINLALVDAY
jgi:hypothetical protein